MQHAALRLANDEGESAVASAGEAAVSTACDPGAEGQSLGISHDLLTLIAIVDGVAQRLQRRAGQMSADEVSVRAKKLRSTVQRMLCLHEKLRKSGLGAASRDYSMVSSSEEGPAPPR